MFTEQELLQLWSNDQKRREFVKNYKVWGVWFTQPELDLTYYRYDLPGGDKLIAMEYQRGLYPGERHNGNGDSVMLINFYLQRGKYFTPTSVSDHVIAERLKDIKETLNKEQKQRDSQCRKCGSRCLRYKPDGTVQCTACMAYVA